MCFEECVGQGAAVNRRKAILCSSKGLVYSTILIFGLFTALPESPCALAFIFSSQTTKTSPSGTNAKDSRWGHECRIHGQIRKAGTLSGGTRRQPSGTQNILRQMQKKQSHGDLSSTMEKSAGGGVSAESFLSPSNSPAVVTTTFNATNATETKQTIQTKKAKDSNHHHPKVPRHVGLICDGNGRWATQRNLPRAAGHLAGARCLIGLIQSLLKERKEAAADNSLVSFITLYAFSTENWNRSPLEISKIFDAIEFAAAAIQITGDVSEIDLKVVGDLSDDRIPVSLKTLLSELEERTMSRRREDSVNNKNRLLVCLAVNYGGRRDIVSACRSLAEALQDGRIESSEDITEDSLQKELSTREIPPPDLIVRTGGEHRLSNFLLWESAYAELYVSQVLWPDFACEGEWKRSLEWYSQRERNFGGRKE